MSFLLKAILILWLSFLIARFVIRFFLRSAGFTVHYNGRQRQEQPHHRQRGPQQPPPAKPDPKGHVTDNLGDYVDFEEVK